MSENPPPNAGPISADDTVQHAGFTYTKAEWEIIETFAREFNMTIDEAIVNVAFMQRVRR